MEGCAVLYIFLAIIVGVVVWLNWVDVNEQFATQPGVFDQLKAQGPLDTYLIGNQALKWMNHPYYYNGYPYYPMGYAVPEPVDQYFGLYPWSPL